MGNRSVQKTKKRVLLGLLALGLLIGIILVGKLAGFVISLNSPYYPVSKSEIKMPIWKESSNFNVTVKTGNFWSVFLLNPNSKTLTVVKIPNNLQTEISTNADLVKISLKNLLGIPISRYWLFPDQKTPEKLIDNLRTGLVSEIPELKDATTDLSIKEIFGVVSYIRGLRFDKIKFLDLSQTEATHWSVHSDGSRFLTVDLANLDHYLASYLADSRLSSEGLTIMVINATPHPGQAEKTARLITNLGGRVVLTASSKESLDKTLVLGKNSETKDSLSDIFNLSCRTWSKFFLIGGDDCAKLSASLTQVNPDINLSRADITVIIGEDYVKFNDLSPK